MSDGQRSYRFCLYDEVIDTYASQIGPHGLAVYAVLARYAKKRESWPSYATIRKKLGMSRRGVIYAMDKLIEVGLVQKEARTSTTGAPSSNLYALADLSSQDEGSAQDAPGSAYSAPSSAQDAPGSAYSAPEGVLLKDPEEILPPALPSVELPPQLDDVQPALTPSRKRSTKTHMAPDDFVVTAEMRLWAAEWAPDVDIDLETELFRNHEFYRAHQMWAQTWRNWMLKAWKDQQEHPLPRRPRPFPLTRTEQRAIDDARTNQELEDLALGRHTHNSVWAPPERHGKDIPRDPGHRREGGILARCR